MSKVINSFPGYEFVYDPEDKKFHNMYMGTDLGFGGYVYAEPGMYTDVAVLDVASLHPNSAVQLNAFGEYTKNFKDILDIRLLIKHKKYDEAKKLFGGKLAKYLDNKDQAKQLSQALKIAINSVYGLSSATFENPFRDPRNKNNIVALRGALFMRTLQEEVSRKGFTVAHIKTDSIKIPNATKDIIDFCIKFAAKYGYTFEHESTYEKMCLVNDAVYIAKYANKNYCKKKYGYIPSNNEDHPNEWTATGAQFQVPYVFKTLFSKEPIEFEDLCVTKAVSKGALYLNMNENLNKDNFNFIGKIGLFCPIKPGKGGGDLVIKRDEDKYDYAAGAKGYRWMESEMVSILKKKKDIDRSYFNALVDKAVDAISLYGDFEMFVGYEYKHKLPQIISDPLPDDWDNL